MCEVSTNCPSIDSEGSCAVIYLIRPVCIVCTSSPLRFFPSDCTIFITPRTHESCAYFWGPEQRNTEALQPASHKSESCMQQ